MYVCMYVWATVNSEYDTSVFTRSSLYIEAKYLYKGTSCKYTDYHYNSTYIAKMPS